MLVISRKSQQAIVLSGGVTIEILEVRGRTVKVGITAPESVTIVRAEVLGPREPRDLASECACA